MFLFWDLTFWTISVQNISILLSEEECRVCLIYLSICVHITSCTFLLRFKHINKGCPHFLFSSDWETIWRVLYLKYGTPNQNVSVSELIFCPELDQLSADYIDYRMSMLKQDTLSCPKSSSFSSSNSHSEICIYCEVVLQEAPTPKKSLQISGHPNNSQIRSSRVSSCAQAESGEKLLGVDPPNSLQWSDSCCRSLCVTPRDIQDQSCSSPVTWRWRLPGGDGLGYIFAKIIKCCQSLYDIRHSSA